MDIYAPYIKGFRESNKVYFFEGFGGFWIDQEPEVYAKMKSYRKEIRIAYKAIAVENKTYIPDTTIMV